MINNMNSLWIMRMASSQPITIRILQHQYDIGDPEFGKRTVIIYLEGGSATLIVKLEPKRFELSTSCMPCKRSPN